eukprot:6048623-Pyramimonas_sp.AAC.1
MALLKLLLAPKQLAKKWHIGDQSRAALRSTIIGGQWSQARLNQYGYASDGVCQYCLDCPGTLHHRLWCCPMLQQEREEAVDSEVIQAARAAPQSDLMFTRALMPRDALPRISAPSMGDIWSFAHGGDTAALTGDIYTDGSGLAPICWPEANRAGWGIAVMTGQTMRGIAYGLLPGHHQSVPRAELYAVTQALRHGTAPMHIRTDCLGIVEGLQHGREWCIHSSRPNNDIWKL